MLLEPIEFKRMFTTPFIYNQIEAIDLIFDKLTYGLHDVEIESLLMESTDDVAQNIQAEILAIYHNHLYHVLALHGINLSADEYVDLDLQIKLVETIIAVQEYPDDEAILSILDNSEDNEDCLAEIVNITVGIDVGELMWVVKSVDGKFLSNIRAHIEHDEAITSEPKAEITEFAKRRVGELLGDMEASNTAMYKYLQMGGRLGYDALSVTKLMLEHLIALPPQDKAFQLTIIMLGSDTMPADYESTMESLTSELDLTPSEHMSVAGTVLILLAGISDE